MSKPIVTCELLSLDPVEGHPVGTMRARVHRISTHPLLGEAKAGTATYTSQIVRIDFFKKEIETLNTIYKY